MGGFPEGFGGHPGMGGMGGRGRREEVDTEALYTVRPLLLCSIPPRFRATGSPQPLLHRRLD